MARLAVWAWMLVLVGLSVPAIASAGAVDLRISYGDGAGHRKAGHLICDSRGPRATGYLRSRDPAKLCRAAYRLKRFLAAPPPENRMCTQIYGGPDRARVRGNVADARVDRIFTRTNGCEVADWGHAQALLPRPA